jgi:transketolase
LNPFNYSAEQLRAVALDVRRDIITMLVEAKSGHTGGPLSCADFATALSFRFLNHKPSEPHWPDRDFLFYSIGHVTPVNYSVLAECGYFPLKDLMTFRKLNGRLQGHPHRLDTPGIEVSSGSLGQGLSIACGQRFQDRQPSPARLLHYGRWRIAGGFLLGIHHVRRSLSS